MIFGKEFCTILNKFKKCCLFFFMLLITTASSTHAVTVSTSSLEYAYLESLQIYGIDFGIEETVTIEAFRYDGSLIESWTAFTDLDGKFTTSWSVPYDETMGDTVTIVAVGQTSEMTATTSVTAPTKRLNQLQNGTFSSDANWANGNINGSNSCYSEGDVVAYRYSIKKLEGGSEHYFTISAEATKSTIHAFDYFADYDLTELVGITAAGGPCGTISTTPPAGCLPPTNSFPFTDPTVASNYTGLPGDMTNITTGGFSIETARNLWSSNAIVDSMSDYTYEGTDSDRELTVTVYFTTTGTGEVDVMFFWGGHLSEGTLSNWGLSNGTSAVDGSPYHMRAINFDSSGSANQDRSIKDGVVCLPPSVEITSSEADSVCAGASGTLSVPTGATDYTWTLSGGTIDSGQGTNTLYFTAGLTIGDYLIFSIDACDSLSGCPGDACCGFKIDSLLIGDCCDFSMTCPSNVTIGCDESTDTTNTGSPTLTLSGSCPSITITYSDSETPGACPQEKTITRTFYAIDGSDTLGTCTQEITVEDNTAPKFDADPPCPADVTVECDNVPDPPFLTASDTSDNCDPNPIVSYNQDSVSLGWDYQLTRTWIATDACGNADTCTQVITVEDKTAPTFDQPGCPADVTVECDNNIPTAPTLTATDNCDPAPTVSFSETSVPGACPQEQVITRVWIASDACENADTCTQVITVVDTTPPTFNPDPPCPADVTVECHNVPVPPILTADDNCDPNPIVTYNQDSVSLECGYQLTRRWIASDACENADTCTQIITVVDTTPPTFDQACPANVTVECDNIPTAPTLTSSDNCDPSPSVTPSETSAPGACPQEQIITRTWTATDACGNMTVCAQVITVNDTQDPVCSVPNDTTIVICNTQTICLPVSASDNCDPNPTCTKISGPGALINGNWCYSASTNESVTVTIKCSDACGNTCQSTFTVNFTLDPNCNCPSITIEKTHKTFQGQFEKISVAIDGLGFEIGGYDLVIQYDASALSVVGTELGLDFAGCGWEYFTYRFGASGNCGANACPSGKLRVMAIADVSNGANHPSCYGVSSGEMVELTFLVTSDRTFECQYVPIVFCWYDCGDNSLSDKDGNLLYLSNDVYNFGSTSPITDLGAEFPSLYGANSSCDIKIGDGKPDPIRCINFYNGGIDIACADSIDARGDINLNEIANEIADAVLLSNYFVYGISVFDENLEGQIAASDVNADGLSLSVADLVYLIRVIVGDALPYAKISPISAEYKITSNNSIWVSDKMGGAQVIVSGETAPLLLADNMEMIYNYDIDNNVTRILVYSMESGQSFSGEFISFEGDVISLELATYEGAMVNAKLMPNSFLLNQNYPNPFNPSTTISFELAKASDYKLSIYNVTGQKVAEFTGYAEAGKKEIVWDASSAATGIYLYKLVTAEFSDIKKMVLLK